MQATPYDLIVIGSGGGLKLARAVARQGRRIALIEAREIGGTCLNRGCIPSKLLIYPADLSRMLARCASLNLHLDHPPQIDFPALVDRVQATIAGIASTLEQTVQSQPGIDLYRRPARLVAPHTVESGTQRLSAPRMVIATGSRPTLPDLPGLDGVDYLTSEDALRCRTLPKRLIVLGAGYIACELGHAYGTFGAETHFVVRSACLRREDAEIQALFQTAFGRQHRLHLGAVAESVRKGPQGRGVTLRLRQGADGPCSDLTADALLVATGVTPETDRLGLDSAGIHCTPDGFIAVDDHLQTTQPGVYAMGDCIGRYLYRHAVNFEAEYLAATLFADDPKPVRYPPMPGAVFTDPEVASVGLTEAQAAAQGIDYRVGRAEIPESNMGMARQLTEGRVKLIIARGDRRLIGAHIVGEDAATLLHIPLAVMTLNGTIDDLLRMIYIHPAYPEVVRDAARDAAG